MTDLLLLRFDQMNVSNLEKDKSCVRNVRKT